MHSLSRLVRDVPQICTGRSSVRVALDLCSGSSSTHSRTAPLKLVTSATSASPQGTFSCFAFMPQSILETFDWSPHVASVAS